MASVTLGLQVAPAELELFLLNHPDVTDAAVMGAKMYAALSPRILGI